MQLQGPIRHMNLPYYKKNLPVAIWLFSVCVGIFVMIFIGGLTRLTDSGLSITEWKPVLGIVPPVDFDSWNIEFEKYKQSPEYIKHNMGMSLDEFKSIYLLEFIHRIAGRLITILYVIPFIIFILKGNIRGKQIPIYVFALFILIMQGIVGWYMVKSGLVSDPYVSHYRLSLHLMLAVFLYIIIFWQLMRNSFEIMLLPSGVQLYSVATLCKCAIVLLLIQIMFGGFVAGLDAGLVYNSFPMMGDNFVPDELSKFSLSVINWSDPVFVQFVHRILAYLLFIIICVFCMQSIRLGNNKLFYAVCSVFFALTLQICLGICTLLYNVPIELALLHQIGAIFLLSCLLWSYFLIKSSET